MSKEKVIRDNYASAHGGAILKRKFEDFEYMPVELVCGSCGKKLKVEVIEMPAFVFEKIALVNRVGWKGFNDHNTPLIFCSDKCVDDYKLSKKKKL